MRIYVNSEPCDISLIALDHALAELGYERLTVATALNGEFVAVTKRAKTMLAENDRLELLAPMQGG